MSHNEENNTAVMKPSELPLVMPPLPPKLWDFHAWLEAPNGIYDPDATHETLVEHMDMVANIRFGHTDYEWACKEWENVTPEILKYELELKDFFIQNPHMLKIVWDDIENKVGFSLQRVVILHLSIPESTRIVYGSMGIKSNGTGKTWWEHGNGGTNMPGVKKENGKKENGKKGKGKKGRGKR